MRLRNPEEFAEDFPSVTDFMENVTEENHIYAMVSERDVGSVAPNELYCQFVSSRVGGGHLKHSWGNVDPDHFSCYLGKWDREETGAAPEIHHHIASSDIKLRDEFLRWRKEAPDPVVECEGQSVRETSVTVESQFDELSCIYWWAK